MSSEGAAIPCSPEYSEALEAIFEASEWENDAPLAASVRLDQAFLAVLAVVGSYDEAVEIFRQAGREYHTTIDELNYLETR